MFPKHNANDTNCRCDGCHYLRWIDSAERNCDECGKRYDMLWHCGCHPDWGTTRNCSCPVCTTPPVETQMKLTIGFVLVDEYGEQGGIYSDPQMALNDMWEGDICVPGVMLYSPDGWLLAWEEQTYLELN